MDNNFDLEDWLTKNVKLAFHVLGVEKYPIKLEFNYNRQDTAAGQFFDDKNTIEFCVNNLLKTNLPLDVYAAYVAFHEVRHVYQFFCKRPYRALGIAPDDYKEYRRLHDLDTGIYPENCDGENRNRFVLRPRELDATAFGGKLVLTLYGYNLKILSDEQREKMLPYMQIFDTYLKEKAEKINLADFGCELPQTPGEAAP